MSLKKNIFNYGLMTFISVAVFTACDVQLSPNDQPLSGEACENLNHNQTVYLNRYKKSSVPEGQSCESERVTLEMSCLNGTVSIVPNVVSFLSCEEDSNPEEEYLSCGEVEHGGPISRDGFSVPQVAHVLGYSCDDRRVNRVVASCVNGDEVPVDPAPSNFYLACSDLPAPGGTGDPLVAFMTAKSQLDLSIVSTTAAFQQHSFTASKDFELKFFYSRSANNVTPNTVIAISDRPLIAGREDSYYQAAITIRCNNGAFDVRSGSSVVQMDMTCAIGNAYMIDVTVLDATDRRFNVSIEDKNGVVATKNDLAFRTSYSGDVRLSKLNFISDGATSSGNTRIDRITNHVFDNNEESEEEPEPGEASCSNGLAHGQSQTQRLYRYPSVPNGQTCSYVDQSRSCTNGQLSAYLPSTTYTNANCFVESEEEPEIPGGSACASGSASQITQRGVTWKFSTAVQCGHYVNGDYWVKAPVTITQITTEGGGGTMLNPVPGGKNGFHADALNSSSRDYDASLNINSQLPKTVQANDMLVSASTYGSFNSNYDTILKHIVALSVVGAPPASGAFRPAVFRSAHNQFNYNNINWSKLKNLALPAGAPTIDSVLSQVSVLPWIDWCGSYICKKAQPRENTIHENYGREIAKKFANAALALNMNYDQDKKRQLAIRVIQAGIDIYGYLKNGQKFDPDGGHKHGRKMPILLAGVLLNDQEILNYASNPSMFQEDMQTFMITSSDVGRNLSDGKMAYQSHMVGCPEWGVRHGTRPSEDNADWDQNYRTVNGSSTIGSVLAARIMGIEAQWNHDAIFRYWDRYYEIEKGNAGGGANSISTFVNNSWIAYRNLNGVGLTYDRSRGTSVGSGCLFKP